MKKKTVTHKPGRSKRVAARSSDRGLAHDWPATADHRANAMPVSMVKRAATSPVLARSSRAVQRLLPAEPASQTSRQRQEAQVRVIRDDDGKSSVEARLLQLIGGYKRVLLAGQFLEAT